MSRVLLLSDTNKRTGLTSKKKRSYKLVHWRSISNDHCRQMGLNSKDARINIISGWGRKSCVYQYYCIISGKTAGACALPVPPSLMPLKMTKESCQFFPNQTIYVWIQIHHIYNAVYIHTWIME